MLRLSVVGSGFVGLVTAACFTELGFPMICTDKSDLKIQSLQRDHVPFFEPELDELVAEQPAIGFPSFTTDLNQVINASDVIMIAVGTPIPTDGAEADLSQLFAACRAVVAAAYAPKTVVIKSTVPVGTATTARAALAADNAVIHHHVVSNPEFPRDVVCAFLKPNRIVVGVDSPQAEYQMEALYCPSLMMGCHSL